MHDHLRPEGAAALPIDWLVTPGLAFSHPNEVLDHPELSQAERQAILASWASDARALEGSLHPGHPTRGRSRGHTGCAVSITDPS